MADTSEVRNLTLLTKSFFSECFTLKKHTNCSCYYDTDCFIRCHGNIM